MSLMLSGLPIWELAIVLVILPTVVAMSGPILIRRRVDLAKLVTNNEIAGFKFATVGVIYAVLLAFAVIVVWEKFSDAEAAVVEEAGAAATLYRLSAGADPEAVSMRLSVSNYLTVAIVKDWEAMAGGRESPAVTDALDHLYATALVLNATGTRSQAEMTEMFRQLDSITQARRSRLHLATGAVPGVLWATLFIGGLLTVGFTFFFGSENLPAQVAMTGVLSVIVTLGLFVIVSIDRPFSGPVHVGAEPLATVLEVFGQKT